MVEPELGLFQVNNELIFRDTLELHKPVFGIPPKTLNSVDVAAASAKLIFTMVDTKMLRIPQIDQAVITAPTVIMDNAFNVGVTSYDLLERICRSIRNYLGVNLAVALIQAKYDGFIAGSATTSPSARV
jgi:hypothetical protein